MNRIFCFLLIIVFLTSFSLKEKKVKNSYKPIIAEPVFENLKMIGSVGKFGVVGKTKTIRIYGKMLRSLRFQNITRKVEKKYGLKENLILAMVMHESSGIDLLPNGLDDGGLGLCHMQPLVASNYGLKIYTESKKLRDKKLGRNLRKLIKQNKYDRKKLVKYDDRFHPIVNLDAVGRMLADYKKPRIRGLKDAHATAIYRYAGRYNYRKYWRNVKYYMAKLDNPKVLKELEESFNELNPDLKINGKKGDFKTYIKIHQEQTVNYGLNDYK